MSKFGPVFLGILAALAVSARASAAAAEDGPVLFTQVLAKPGKVTPLNGGIWSVMSQTCTFVPRAMQVITQPTQGSVIPKMIKIAIDSDTANGEKAHDCKGTTVNALQILYRAKPNATGTDEVFIRTIAELPPYKVSYYKYLIRFP